MNTLLFWLILPLGLNPEILNEIVIEYGVKYAEASQCVNVKIDISARESCLKVDYTCLTHKSESKYKLTGGSYEEQARELYSGYNDCTPNYLMDNLGSAI